MHVGGYEIPRPCWPDLSRKLTWEQPAVLGNDIALKRSTEIMLNRGYPFPVWLKQSMNLKRIARPSKTSWRPLKPTSLGQAEMPNSARMASCNAFAPKRGRLSAERNHTAP